MSCWKVHCVLIGRWTHAGNWLSQSSQRAMFAVTRLTLHQIPSCIPTKQSMYSQTQKFTDFVFDFLYKQLNFEQNRCMAEIPSRLQSAMKSLWGACHLLTIPKFICLHRNENTKSVKFSSFLYMNNTAACGWVEEMQKYKFIL